MLPLVDGSLQHLNCTASIRVMKRYSIVANNVGKKLEI
jgi:hypothetical protein